jgi:hypothetical protein
MSLEIRDLLRPAVCRGDPDCFNATQSFSRKGYSYKRMPKGTKVLNIWSYGGESFFCMDHAQPIFKKMKEILKDVGIDYES